MPSATIQAERRAPFGEALLASLSGTTGTIAFDDLARTAGPGARYSDIVRWLASCQSAGLIEDAGYALDVNRNPIGPRRWRATDAGRRLVAADRRRKLS